MKHTLLSSKRQCELCKNEFKINKLEKHSKGTFYFSSETDEIVCVSSNKGGIICMACLNDIMNKLG